MPRERNPNRDIAFELFRNSQGKLTNREIANRLNEDEKVIAVWKGRDKWVEKGNVVQQSSKRCTTNKKESKKPIAEEVKLVMDNPELTDKQRLFCLHYVKCFNATKAYLKAYEGSYSVANVEGPRLLVNPSVKAEIYRMKQGKLNQAFFDADDIVQKYMDIAFSDMTDYVTFGVREVTFSNSEGMEATTEMSYVDVNESWMVDGSLISEISQGKEGIKLKLADRMKALEWLSKYFLTNPLDKHRIEYDKRKLEIEIIKLDYEAKKNEPNATTTGNDNFLDALNAKAKEVWNDDE